MSPQTLQRLRRAFSEFMAAAECASAEMAIEGIVPNATPRPAVLMLQKMVCAHYQLPLAAMTSSLRTARYALARQVAMHLTREFTRHALSEIGRCFGGRDHGTVIAASRSVLARAETDRAFAATLAQLTTHARELFETAKAT